MQRTCLDVGGRSDPTGSTERISIGPSSPAENTGSTPRPGRHRRLAASGRHRHRRITPLVVGVVTVVLTTAVAVGVHSGSTAGGGPEPDVTLGGVKVRVIDGVAPQEAPPPATTVPPPVAVAPRLTEHPPGATRGAAPTPQRKPAPMHSSSRGSGSSRSVDSHGSSSGVSGFSSRVLRDAQIQWRGDFDSGDTSQWDLETARDYSLRVMDAGPGHPTAARFEVRHGDTPVDSGERSEAEAPHSTDVSEGDERWYSFSMMFDKSFPVASSFCDPMQWHPAGADGEAADGSPPLNLQCGSDDKLSLEVGDHTVLPIGPLDRGRWHHYELHVKFSKDPDVAFEEMSRDGQLVIPKVSPAEANMTTPKLYLKIGMYRDSENDLPMVVWHDDLAIYTRAP